MEAMSISESTPLPLGSKRTATVLKSFKYKKLAANQNLTIILAIQQWLEKRFPVKRYINLIVVCLEVKLNPMFLENVTKKNKYSKNIFKMEP